MSETKINHSGWDPADEPIHRQQADPFENRRLDEASKQAFAAFNDPEQNVVITDASRAGDQLSDAPNNVDYSFMQRRHAQKHKH
jgi:hypothetical protein